MGLLLSILVTCVGVVELIEICRNVRARLNYRRAPPDFDCISDGYLRELTDLRRRIYEDLLKIRNDTDVADLPAPLPTFRLNSHEDIEIEFDEQITKSRSPSPRSFLVTEKEPQSPRRFIVTESNLKKSKSQNSIPEYAISEEQNSVKSPNNPRYILKEQTGNSVYPIPLPKQFIVTENDLNIFNEPDDEEEHFRRSPSPYPPLDVAYKNSISPNLVAVCEEQVLYNDNLSKVEQELQEALEETSSFNADYLNNLDGVNKKKICSRKLTRRKHTGSLDITSTSKDSEDDNKCSGEKQPEPFWVKNLE